MSTWVVWANSQFDAWKFVLFFVSSPRPQVAFLDTSQRSIRHYASFPPRKCLLGVRKIKFEISPLLLPKNVKIGTLSWRSMENCSRPTSEMVSRIMFKLVHGLTTQVASRDMTPRSKGQRSRSQRNVTYPCNNSVLGARIKFILGS